MFQSVLAGLAALVLAGTQPSDDAVQPADIDALRARAEQNDIDAQFELAFELFRLELDNSEPGHDVLTGPRVSEARSWARRAADNDHAEATNLLGQMARTGFGRARDPVAAIEHFRRSHELGSSAASLNLGIHLLMMEPDETVQREGFDILVALQARQDADDLLRRKAAGYVGYALSVSAGGVEIDHDRGFELLNIGIQADPTEPNFNFILARYHESTAGGPVDMPRALQHFITAGENGHGYAAWRAGMILLSGEAGAPDETAAFEMVRQAAELGDEDGMVSLAVMYALGQGTPIRAELSREWYGRVAARGNAHALRALGMMLVTGEGGDEDLIMGTALLNLAIIGGDQPATYWRDQIELGGADNERLVREAEEAWLRNYNLKREDLYGGQVQD